MIGQTISHYSILEKLGEGGMGVVYKARDTKLDRDVALKFLPAQLAASEADRARFIQEAKAAAALNHPNVCSIIDIQEHEASDGGGKQMFIVMEFVDGQTLRERSVGQGPGSGISLKQAIDIGIQVADGLAAAHEKGIVHRDIKPENIMIRRDGIAQVMDFGLAKLRASSSKITRLTRQGSTVGTAGYMSPEQVQGQEADHRSDIFSFGVLLYELFTGELPFKGVHETALAYEIVNVDPVPMSVARPALDPALDAIVLECLAKEKAERFQSVAEVAKELRRFKRESSRQSVSRISAVRASGHYSGAMTSTPSGSATAADPGPGGSGVAAGRPGRGVLLPWTVAAVFLLAAGVFAWMKFSSVPPVPEELRLNILPPPGGSIDNSPIVNSAISPDGRMVAFTASDSTGRGSLYVRPLREESSRRLPGTEDAFQPFWSPDSRSIGFFSQGKLKKIEVVGGSPLTICNAELGRGATWSRDGVIVFASAGNTPLSRVNAAGGEVSPATILDSTLNETTHRWPYFLPDGRHFLFFSRTGRAAGGEQGGKLFLGALDSPERQSFMNVGSNVEYANGYLYYIVENSLMARRFDPDKFTLIGDPFAVAQNVMFAVAINRGAFSVSGAGDIVFSSGKASDGRLLKWYDRKGTEIASVSNPSAYINVRISPEGKRIAFEELDRSANNRDIWTYDLERQTKSRLTFDAAADRTPVWSPDGRTIYFCSNREDVFNIYKKDPDGTGADEPVFKSGAIKRPYSIPGDGSHLFFYQKKSDGNDDIYVIPLKSKPEAVPVVTDGFDKDNPAISPDGKWLAYCSNETGSYQVYIVPFPPTGGRYQVSSTEATFPLWSRNGKELFYLTGEDQIVSTLIDVRDGVLRVGKTENLFRAKLFTGTEMPFDVTPDGSRFLCIVEGGGNDKAVLTVVKNWPRPEQNK